MNFFKIHKKYLLMSAVIWAVCLVIFVVAYVFIIGPQKSSKKLIENKLAEKRKIYESAIKAAQDETKLELNKQIERLHHKLRDFVVDFEDSANLTFDLSQIAEEKKVTSFGSKVKSKLGLTNKDEYKYISENEINITFTGDFNQFATFLNDLERHRPVIFVEKFSLIRSSGRNDSGYRINLNVTAFVIKQQDSETADKGKTQVYGKKI